MLSSPIVSKHLHPRISDLSLRSCEVEVYDKLQNKKIATLTAHTPDLKDPCKSSDELLQLFKWLPKSGVEETLPPSTPLQGELDFKEYFDGDQQDVEHFLFEYGRASLPSHAHVFAHYTV
jgi:hypothetical protein